jgi:hypothetical protein
MAASGDDNSEVFWPGYVDAVTNLVLSLLFLLTIMTVAVFMFALELGKKKYEQLNPPTPTTTVAISTPPNDLVLQEAKRDELKKQIDALQEQSRQLQNEIAGRQKVIEASAKTQEPEKRLKESTLAGGGVVVHFTADAVSLTSEEEQKLRKTLDGLATSGKKLRLVVRVPAGFSEARRLGFYRAMTVRNLLLDMKVPSSDIEVAVTEGTTGNPTQVVVTPR